jgi:hypothetical protein
VCLPSVGRGAGGGTVAGGVLGFPAEVGSPATNEVEADWTSDVAITTAMPEHGGAVANSTGNVAFSTTTAFSPAQPAPDIRNRTVDPCGKPVARSDTAVGLSDATATRGSAVDATAVGMITPNVAATATAVVKDRRAGHRLHRAR